MAGSGPPPAGPGGPRAFPGGFPVPSGAQAGKDAPPWTRGGPRRLAQAPALRVPSTPRCRRRVRVGLRSMSRRARARSLGAQDASRTTSRALRLLARALLATTRRCSRQFQEVRAFRAPRQALLCRGTSPTLSPPISPQPESTGSTRCQSLDAPSRLPSLLGVQPLPPGDRLYMRAPRRSPGSGIAEGRKLTVDCKSE